MIGYFPLYICSFGRILIILNQTSKNKPKMLSALGHLLAAATKSKQANDSFTCDHPAPMDSAFDATRYMGKWYGRLHTAN